MTDRMKNQSNEFDAMEELSKCWKILQMIAVVDDDYPAMRHYYERARRNYIEACGKNK